MVFIESNITEIHACWLTAVNLDRGSMLCCCCCRIKGLQIENECERGNGKQRPLLEGGGITKRSQRLQRKLYSTAVQDLQTYKMSSPLSEHKHRLPWKLH